MLIKKRHKMNKALQQLPEYLIIKSILKFLKNQL